MTSLTRRGIAASLAGLPFAAAIPTPLQAKAPAQGLADIQPLARLRIGRFEVTVLSDGFIDLPFGAFTGATPEQVKQAAESVHAARPAGIRAGFSAWLINDGSSLTLVDTGAAGTVSPTSGRLPAALKAIGVSPEAIDAVIITHMHVDHISGLVAGGKRAFANAELYVDRRDVAYFTDTSKIATAPEILKSSFAKAGEVARLYPALQRIDGEREITRGISIVDLAGHTPGHVGVRIADGAESLTLVGDMLFHPAAHPALPGIGIIFEADKAAADAARARFFPRAAEEKSLIAATHMPFPGIGRIVRDGGTHRWLAADWEYGG